MSGQLRTEDNETLFGEEFSPSVTELGCLTDSLSMNQFGLALFTKWQLILLTVFIEIFYQARGNSLLNVFSWSFNLMQLQMRLKYTLRPLKLQSKVVALLSNRFISAFDKGCQMLQLIVSTNQNEII